MLAQDLRYAVRSFARSPGFTAVAVISLALGIGANSAIFSLIDAMILRKLPVKDPQGLYIVGDPASVNSNSFGSQRTEIFSYPTYKHLRERARIFDGMFASGGTGHLELTIGGKLDATNVRGRLVSGTYFPLLGVNAQMGRALTPEDDKVPGAHPVVVISDAFWHKTFAAKPDILSQTIGLNGRVYTIVGVMPPEFTGEVVGQAQDVWAPMAMQAQIMPGREWLNEFRRSWLQVMVRLKPGVSEQQARAAMDVLVKQILIEQGGPGMRPNDLREFREAKILFGTGATGFSRLRANFSEPLMILMSVVGLVLLIACANVANLLLARATARQREISVRMALGATRARLVRQLLAESVLLSAGGALLGLLMAQWGSQLLLLLVNREGVPLAVHLDLWVLGFTAAIATFTGILFGLGPALRATRIEINSVLKEGSRGLTSSGAKLSLGKLLVVAQVALSLLLLIGAGLFVRSLENLRQVDVGYERDHILMLSVDATAAEYKGERATQLWRQVLANVARVPGVRAASFSENGLFTGSESNFPIDAEGFKAANDRDRESAFDEVGPGYFEAVGITILKGRGVEERDDQTSPKVAWINQAAARFFFKDADPVGKHISYEFEDHKRTVRQIAGVVKDVRDHSLKREIRRRFYVPGYQPFDQPLGRVTLEVRTRAEPQAMSAAIRGAVQSVDRSLPITDLHPLSLNIEDQMTQERMIAQLSTFFGVLALLLAAIGLYGVMSYAMARRTNEIGIRMALGAQPGTVLAMVLRETLVLVGLGLAIGLPAALGLTRLVASRLFGLKPYDPVTIAVAVTVLAVVAAVAGYLPARRAARLNPVLALRYE